MNGNRFFADFIDVQPVYRRDARAARCLFVRDHQDDPPGGSSIDSLSIAIVFKLYPL